MITVPAIRINPRKIATAANTTKLNPCLNLPVPGKTARAGIKQIPLNEKTDFFYHTIKEIGFHYCAFFIRKTVNLRISATNNSTARTITVQKTMAPTTIIVASAKPELFWCS